MRRVFAPMLGLSLAVGCGETETKPTGGEKPPSAASVFDKTEKDLKPHPKAKEKKSSGIG